MLKNTGKFDNMTIIISRTDSIGDVVLTLPVAGLLKKYLPGVRIIFLGQSYTKPVADACEHIDDFADWSLIKDLDRKSQFDTFRKFGADAILHVFPRREIAALALKAGIPKRIGTFSRPYHWRYCNQLVRLSRRHSPLHEAQLNLKLLQPFGMDTTLCTDEIPPLYGFTKIGNLPEELSSLIDPKKFNLVLHPKSKGSAREWGIENFSALADILPEETFKIFVTGTSEEGKILDSEGFFKKAPKITNLTGRFSLSQLIAFIAKADGVVAASTGPLHIAAAAGKIAIGIYPPIKPMHPGRWAPLGKKASYLVVDKECSKCRKSSPCHCMREIKPEDVYFRLLQAMKS